MDFKMSIRPSTVSWISFFSRFFIFSHPVDPSKKVSVKVYIALSDHREKLSVIHTYSDYALNRNLPNSVFEAGHARVDLTYLLLLFFNQLP